MPLSKALFTSASDRWFTPPDLLQEITDFLGPNWFDPCPAKLEGEAIVDGLQLSWAHRRVFCNPPYGRGTINKWVAKALTEPVEEIVLLLPSRTGSPWFKPLRQHSVFFLDGRLHFSGSKQSAPFDSVLVYRGRRDLEFSFAFEHRGDIMRIPSYYTLSHLAERTA